MEFMPGIVIRISFCHSVFTPYHVAIAHPVFLQLAVLLACVFVLGITSPEAEAELRKALTS